MRSMKANKIEMGGLFFLLLLSEVIWGQVPNHTFPRTAVLHWGGAPAEWYAKFDLHLNRDDDKNFITQVKQLNPNLIWLPMRDFNRADEFINGFPEEWFLHDSKGNRISLYGGNTYWADLSDIGVRVNNQRLIDFFPEELARLAERAGADGISSDGLYYRGHLTYDMFDDVDLDHNGVNDLSEHGKSWVINHWSNGVDFFLNKLRNLLGPDKLIVINTGSQDLPTGPAINGLYFEDVGAETNWDYTRTTDAKLRASVHQPPIFVLNNVIDPSNPKTPKPTKGDFQYMRFGLARSMLLGEYFDFNAWEAGEHYWSEYYDEFDLDVGYTRGNMQEIKSGVWARFFDRGAVIANFNDHEVTVTDSELRSLSGYAGPYWHFQGGQDPSMNNGKQFASVQLKGHSYRGYQDVLYVVGDGIVLVKTPQTVIADIIIDNATSGTSGGSVKAALSGNWQLTCDGRDSYSLRCVSWEIRGESHENTAITSNSSSTAIFTPNIGYPGKYEVFEWHGRPNSGTPSSTVTHIIAHANGRTTKIVNQQLNAGRWNFLGTYSFNRGATGSVTIATQGANGLVMADAIKFVFSDGTSGNNTDNTPPAPPREVKVEQQGN